MLTQCGLTWTATLVSQEESLIGLENYKGELYLPTFIEMEFDGDNFG